MKIRENVLYFLKHGKLENVNFGVTKAQLLELLDEPDYLSEHKWADICGYGCFEFYLLKEEWKNHRVERLSVIVANQPFSYETKSNFEFEHRGWTKDLTIEKAVDFLRENDIAFEEQVFDDEDSDDYKDVRILKTEGNVSINFRDWHETGDFVLYQFGRTVELNPIKPPTKQLSFEIEESFYHELRKRSEKTRVSIATICREIIEEHLTQNK